MFREDMCHRSNVAAVTFVLVLLQPAFITVVVAEIVSTGVAVSGAVLASSFLAGYEYFKCQFYECCERPWINANITGLENALTTKLYGQHLVLNTVVSAIKSHLNNENPVKALVMSFHGWTGSGKNYVSQMVVENLYKRGLQSSFVHWFSATFHFAHTSEADLYKRQLHGWILGNVTRCARSLFIFDEVDKMPEGVLAAITPFLDYHPNLKGVDFRKNSIVVTNSSNTGGNDITERTLEYWMKGKSREDIKLKEMEELINIAAFNEPGGLQFTRLISNHVIDHFVPFLPLEQEHVKRCIAHYFQQRHVMPTEKQLSDVVQMLQFSPKDEQLYSVSGCKRVPQKVDLLLEETMFTADHDAFKSAV